MCVLFTDSRTNRPLATYPSTTYPPTHRPTIINLHKNRRPDSEHVLLNTFYNSCTNWIEKKQGSRNLGCSGKLWLSYKLLKYKELNYLLGLPPLKVWRFSTRNSEKITSLKRNHNWFKSTFFHSATSFFLNETN